MPRKDTNPDLGRVPCPTCRAWVPLRKDKRQRLYHVCSSCNSLEGNNEYYLQHARMNGPDGSPPADFQNPGPASMSESLAAAPAPAEQDPGKYVIVPARPTPKKLLAPVPAPVPEAGQPGTGEDPANPLDPPDLVPAAGTDEKPGFWASADAELDAWFKDMDDDQEGVTDES